MAEAGDLPGLQTMSFSFASFIILSSGTDSIVGIADWTDQESYPSGGEIFRASPDCSQHLPSLLHIGYKVFPRC